MMIINNHPVLPAVTQGYQLLLDLSCQHGTQVWDNSYQKLTIYFLNLQGPMTLATLSQNASTYGAKTKFDYKEGPVSKENLVA